MPNVSTSSKTLSLLLVQNNLCTVSNQQGHPILCALIDQSATLPGVKFLPQLTPSDVRLLEQVRT